MRTTLIGAGYEVEDARTGEEGLEKVNSYHPDLVLLDINMPGMGGLLTCEALRMDKNIAIIMLTVRDSRRTKLRHWMLAPLSPFSTPELLARIVRRSGACRFASTQPNSNREPSDRFCRRTSPGWRPFI
jgi:two-component system KDP operon response regulator KdpE